MLSAALNDCVCVKAHLRQVWDVSSINSNLLKANKPKLIENQTEKQEPADLSDHTLLCSP